MTGTNPDSGFRFVAFGDQRALADGEWQDLMRHVGRLAGTDPRVLFMIDTGDIVQDGRHTDQFVMLERILAPAAFLPYWVGVGNHEVHNNRGRKAREHTATFLSSVDGGLTAERLYYAKRVGPGFFVFLDTNDFVYGPEGKPLRGEVPPGSRPAAQLEWLADTLAAEAASPSGAPALVVAVLHHPFLQSSEKHREKSRELWDLRYGGRALPDFLVDAGVDVVLSGHMHTYERYRLRRQDGEELVLVNLSGRPRSSILPLQASRRAEDLSGREMDTLREWGWRGLGPWKIVQEEAMLTEEADQFAVFEVAPDGSLTMDVRFLAPDSPGGLRITEPTVLRRPDR